MTRRWITAAAMAMAVVACSKKTPPPEVAATKPVPSSELPAEDPNAKKDAIVDASRTGEVRLSLERIHFEFDSANLTEEARGILNKNAEQLKTANAVKLTIEGHCDDVGTTEYNLALGERRAAATRQYLVRLGLEEARLQIISYGKERPLAANEEDTGRAKNRRAEMVPTL